MSEVEVVIDMPAEYSSMVFGQFDEYAKAIESNLNIELIARDGVVKIIGAEANVIRARGVLDNLIELARRGNQISRQSVDYAISLSFDDCIWNRPCWYRKDISCNGNGYSGI